jgi:PAS domain S-box-containing protein
MLDVNEAYERLFGWKRAEILGRSTLELDIWVDAREREALRARLAATKRVAGYVSRARRRGGEEFDSELAAEVIEEHGEQLLLVIVQDVTERRRAEQALRAMADELEMKVQARTAELAEANKELEAFAYSVSHDLRAPLRGIDGFSQVLMARHAAKLDDEARRLLERVRAGAQRMGMLIADLLNLSRVGRAELRMAEVDLSALAAEIAAELGAAHPGRAMDWRIEPGMRVRGDAGLLRVALANLLENAIKYTRDAAAPRAEVGVARRLEGRVEFCVRDNGAGFDMAYAGQLFLPFRRLHAPHEFEGTGIGLATVARVVARHGGEVRGEGRVGEGAAFYFTLPAA